MTHVTVFSRTDTYEGSVTGMGRSSGLSAPMEEAINDELLHVATLGRESPSIAKPFVWEKIPWRHMTHVIQLYPTCSSCSRCEMGNRAVEMMVDTGAQTSAAQLQPSHFASRCITARVLQRPGNLHAVGENVGLGVAAGQSIPRTAMRRMRHTHTHTLMYCTGTV